MYRLVVVAIVAGCIEVPADVPCGALICPKGDVCLADQTCATADAVAACTGLADGTTCQAAEFSGTCAGGACLAPRCGDDIVESPEQCDGAIASDCVDFGYDLGKPTCTACVVDLADTCQRFGWQPIFDVAAIGGWTDGTTFALLYLDPRTLAYGLDIYVSGSLVATQPNINSVAGNSHRVLAFPPFVEWNGTALVSFDAGDIGQLQDPLVALDDSDVLYALATDSNGCALYVQTPGSSAMKIPVSATDNCATVTAQEGRVVVATYGTTDASVYELTGDHVTLRFTQSNEVITGLTVHGGVLYASGNQHVYVFDGTLTSIIETYGNGGAVAITSGVYFGGTAATNLVRVADSQSEVLATPIVGSLIGDGTTMYLVGAGVYAYTGLDYSVREPIGYGTAVSVLGDGTPVLGNDVGWVLTPLVFTSWFSATTTSGAAITSVTGASVSDFYATDGTHLDHGNAAGAAMTTVTWNLGGRIARGLWESPAGVLYAVGDGMLAMQRATNGTWTAIAPPSGVTGCDLLGVTGAGTTVIAAATCGSAGAVWQLAGATWTEIYRGSRPLAAVALDVAGDIFAAGPSGGARDSGGTWSDDPGAIGQSVSATSVDDVWVAGAPGTVSSWNGTAWSRLGVVGPSDPRVVATDRAVYMSGVSNPVLLR